jgi:NADPH2:quinone reductase
VRRRAGKVASTNGAADEQVLAGAGLAGTNIMASPVTEVIASLAEQAAAGALKVDVAEVLPFERAADGLATIASGKASGKLVVKVGE